MTKDEIEQMEAGPERDYQAQKAEMNAWATAVFSEGISTVPNLDKYYPNVTREHSRQMVAEAIHHALRAPTCRNDKDSNQPLRWIEAIHQAVKAAERAERDRHVAMIDRLLVALLGEEEAGSLIYDLASRRDMIGYSW